MNTCQVDTKYHPQTRAGCIGIKIDDDIKTQMTQLESGGCTQLALLGVEMALDSILDSVGKKTWEVHTTSTVALQLVVPDKRTSYQKKYPNFYKLYDALMNFGFAVKFVKMSKKNISVQLIMQTKKTFDDAMEGTEIFVPTVDVPTSCKNKFIVVHNGIVKLEGVMETPVTTSPGNYYEEESSGEMHYFSDASYSPQGRIGVSGFYKTHSVYGDAAVSMMPQVSTSYSLSSNVRKGCTQMEIDAVIMSVEDAIANNYHLDGTKVTFYTDCNKVFRLISHGNTDENEICGKLLGLLQRFPSCVFVKQEGHKEKHLKTCIDQHFTVIDKRTRDELRSLVKAHKAFTDIINRGESIDMSSYDAHHPHTPFLMKLISLGHIPSVYCK